MVKEDLPRTDPALDFVKGAMNTYANGHKHPYAPQRDLMLLWPYVLEELLAWMETKRLPESYKKYMEWCNLTEDDLLNAFNAYVDSANYFVGDKETLSATVDEAFTRSGYAKLSTEQKILLEGLIGRVVLGLYFYSVRDVSEEGIIPVDLLIGYERWPVLMREIKNAVDGVESEYSKKLKKQQKLLDKELGCED